MKINGTVKNATTNEPISGAKVELYVDESEIAFLYTDDKGEFETSQSGDYIGETLVCKVGKDDFEDAEIKMDIEEEEIALNIELIPVHVPIKKITITGSVVDDKTNAPIDGADVTFKVGTEKIEQVKTVADGLFSFEINESYIGKTLEYEAKNEGSQLLTGTIKISEDMGTLELRLDSRFEIPVWMGLKKLKKVFIIGSISFFVVLFIASLNIFGEGFAAVTYLLIGPLYILFATALIKGYLVSIVNSLIGLLNYILYMATSSNDGGAGALFSIYLIMGLISTFFARRKALKRGKSSDTTMSETLLNFFKQSVKRLVILFGAFIVVIGIIILLIIRALSN